MKKAVILILVFLIACTNRATQQSSAEANKLNTEIVLREALGLKDIYDATGVISLDIKNNSDSDVLFPSDFGAQVYVQSGMKWERVNNIFSYSGGDQVLPTTSDYPPGLAVLVKPDLTEITVRPIVLRISVIGVSSNSGKDVEASLDVTVE
jgi:hypothetical protein